MQNTALSRTETFAAKEVEKFISTEEGAIFQSEAMKKTITNGGDDLKKMLEEPIDVVEYNSKTYILDGHNRLKAFSELVDKKVKVTVLSIEDALKNYKSKMEDIIKGNFNTPLKDEHQ